MANYRVEDIIRLTRKSLGMSQEELAFFAGIATETISRIESGKHKITQNTYKKIMEQLNCDAERSFAICSSSDVELLEAKNLLESAEAKFTFSEIGKYLDILKREAVDNPVNLQYIKTSEVLYLYTEGKIDEKVMLAELQETLTLTVKEYTKYLDCKNYKEAGYPFRDQELIILMNIATAYGKLKDYEQAERILQMILRCIEAGYIEGKKVRYLKLLVKRELSKGLAYVQRYEEVLALLNETLEEMVKEGYGLGLSIVLYDISWYMNRINQVEGKHIYSLEEIKRKKRQAYYIAAARKDDYVAEFTKKSYREQFQEEL